MVRKNYNNVGFFNNWITTRKMKWTQVFWYRSMNINDFNFVRIRWKCLARAVWKVDPALITGKNTKNLLRKRIVDESKVKIYMKKSDFLRNNKRFEWWGTESKFENYFEFNLKNRRNLNSLSIKKKMFKKKILHL